MLGPAFRGLNTELSNAAGFQNMDWASVLNNTVFDDLGRVSLRKGYVDQTTTHGEVLSRTLTTLTYAGTVGTSTGRFGYSVDQFAAGSIDTNIIQQWVLRQFYYDSNTSEWVFSLGDGTAPNSEGLTTFYINSVTVEYASGLTSVLDLSALTAVTVSGRKEFRASDVTADVWDATDDSTVRSLVIVFSEELGI
jgi:hypothetical protein